MTSNIWSIFAYVGVNSSFSCLNCSVSGNLEIASNTSFIFLLLGKSLICSCINDIAFCRDIKFIIKKIYLFKYKIILS